MYKPPQQAFSPHISRGYAAQQNSQPVKKFGGDIPGHEETLKRRTSLQAMRPVMERRYATPPLDLTRYKA
jgi:hypothetical protein